MENNLTIRVYFSLSRPERADAVFAAPEAALEVYDALTAALDAKTVGGHD